LKPEALQLLKELADSSARETVIDYYLNRQFRRDLFVRGARELSGQEREEHLLATRFALIAPLPTYPFKVRLPLGELTLEQRPHETILNAWLSSRLASFSPRRMSGGSQAVFQAIVLAIVARLVAPTLDPEGEVERRKSAARFNEAVVSQLG
jgi:hypothetical protein